MKHKQSDDGGMDGFINFTDLYDYFENSENSLFLALEGRYGYG